jgi:endonuclease/exonuclease/phosphatase family metal-dependent hydrolase
VGSYNVRCHSCYTGSREEQRWTDRRDAVVALVEGSDLDVLGVQEANSSRVKNPDGTTSDLSQFEDLVARLGAPWKLVNARRYNCVRHTTTSGCVYRDQGASKGTKILYNADRVKVLASGSKLLAEMEGRSQRYVAWAVLRQRSTGAEFIFADTHLENLDDSAGVYTALRRRQAAGVLGAVTAHNSAGRPAIVVGDFNSDKWTTPSNAPYDLLRSEGYVDPLGNSYHSKTTAPGATVEHRINTSLNTLNSFRRTAPGHPRWVNGTQIDYILTTPMRVLEWETVADLDAYGRFRGPVPSDHNLVRATVVLPNPR